MGKRIKHIIQFIIYRMIDRFTGFTPFKRFIPLPRGKYGNYICENCERNKAKYWDEKSLTKCCFKCAFDSK